MIDIEVFDVEAIDTVDPGGIDNWHREDQQSTFTFAWKGDCFCWSGGDERPPRHSVRSTGWPLVASKDSDLSDLKTYISHSVRFGVFWDVTFCSLLTFIYKWYIGQTQSFELQTNIYSPVFIKAFLHCLFIFVVCSGLHRILNAWYCTILDGFNIIPG